MVLLISKIFVESIDLRVSLLALLTLRGNHFTHGAYMPFTKYRPEATTVSFWIEARDVNVDLSLPRWNISSLYPTPDRSQVGRIGMLNMNGSYRYFAAIKQDNVDQLKLEFTGRDVVYKAFGWTIRYFMILRDNYFGSFTHFSTLTEYLSKRGTGQPLGDPILLQYREGQVCDICTHCAYPSYSYCTAVQQHAGHNGFGSGQRVDDPPCWLPRIREVQC